MLFRSFLCMAEGRKTEGASQLMLWASITGAPMILIAAIAMGEPVFPSAAPGWAARPCTAWPSGQSTGRSWLPGRCPSRFPFRIPSRFPTRCRNPC